MGLFDKTNKAKIGDPRKAVMDLLADMSGGTGVRPIKYAMLYTIYAFKGVVDGVGTSTIVANTALALAELGLSVAVIDSSINAPVQDVLLKTEREVTDPDWFDLPYRDTGYMKQSSFSNKISVLSFGGNRTLLDALGLNDSASLVSLTIAILQNKFDVILIDCCSEMTEISMACLQQAHRVIQVWNDSISVVSNLDRFLDNCRILTCPIDKMRYVVLSKKDPLSYGGSIDSLLDQYKLTLIGTNQLSYEVQSIINQGRLPYLEATKDKGVEAYSECIYGIVSVICHLEDVDTKTKLITSEDMNAKEGKDANSGSSI